MFSKILVALDHGETCNTVFKEALTLAQATGAHLMLVSVFTPNDEGSPIAPIHPEIPYYSPGMTESVWEVYHERYRKYEAHELNRLRHFSDQAITAGVSTEFTQMHGMPGRVICDLAQTWGADLVMVGSHGRKGLSEMLLGSVSNYVIHHVTCSVLVIHNKITPNATIDSSAYAATSKS